MIRFIKGTLAQISEGEIVLEHQGMGFAIFIPGSFMQELPSDRRRTDCLYLSECQRRCDAAFWFFDAGRSRSF